MRKTKIFVPSSEKAFCNGMRGGIIVATMIYISYQIGKFSKKKGERVFNINIHRN